MSEVRYLIPLEGRYEEVLEQLQKAQQETKRRIGVRVDVVQEFSSSFAVVWHGAKGEKIRRKAMGILDEYLDWGLVTKGHKDR